MLDGIGSPEKASAALPASSAPADFPAGSLIIDMGQSPQTVGNGLKPYGFVYELLATLKIPVSWMIEDGKSVMGSPDFSASVVDTGVTPVPPPVTRTFAGGSFVISAEFVAAIPAARLDFWRSLGVKIYRTTSPLTNAPQYTQLRSWPRVVLDSGSGAVANGYYANAGIPTTAYRFAPPSALTACDDLFVYPHSDPTWATANQLLPFNDSGGYLFAQCHGVSVLENVDSPDADTLPNMNFLSTTGEVANDSDTVNVATVPASGQVQVVKYASDLVDTDTPKNGFGDVGDTITYSYLVTNPGPQNLTAVTTTDDKLGAIGGPSNLNANRSRGLHQDLHPDRGRCRGRSRHQHGDSDRTATPGRRRGQRHGHHHHHDASHRLLVSRSRWSSTSTP